MKMNCVAFLHNLGHQGGCPRPRLPTKDTGSPGSVCTKPVPPPSLAAQGGLVTRTVCMHTVFNIKNPTADSLNIPRFWRGPDLWGCTLHTFKTKGFM